MTNVNVGLMKAGDATRDDAISIGDFNLLRGTFGKSFGQPGYNAAADFNNDDVANSGDFNLLRGNFGLIGCPAP